MISYLVKGMRAVATWTASGIGLTGYNATDPRRKLLSAARRPSQSTANELATSSLPSLRNYSRQLERNNPTFRAGVEGLKALIVGSGIALEPDLGDDATNARIRAEWERWIAGCAVDGRDLYSLQNQGIGDAVVSGELIWRLVQLPERLAAGEVPLAVLPIEAEWLDDTGVGTIRPTSNGETQVGAITVDKFGRPVSYRVKSPEITSMYPAEEVPARDVVHWFEKRRAMQTRGEPWSAPIIETLQQERDLVDAELQAAVTGASIGIVVTSESHGDLDTTEEGSSDDPAQTLRVGGVTRLYPGEKVETFNNTRPGQQIHAFRGGLRGDTAAALRVPTRFLDRDISRANYSSMRADMLDTERLLGPVRESFGHGTAGRLFREVLPFLCARAGVPMPKRVAYRLIPDGQPYVDPVKDIAAAQNAIAANLSTAEHEIGKRGGDYRQVWAQAQREKVELAKAEIARLEEIQKAVDEANARTPGLMLNWAQVATLGGAASAPGAYLSAATGSQTAVADPNAPTEPAEDTPEDETEDEGEDMNAADRARMDRMERMLELAAFRSAPAAPTGPAVMVEQRIQMDATTAEQMGRAIGANIKPPEIPAAQVTVHVPQQAAPEVRITTPEAPAPQVVVNVPQAAAPVVNVAAPTVNVENTIEAQPQKNVKAIPQNDGSVLMVPQ